MDGSQSPQDLHRRIGTASAPLVVDVRRAAAFDSDDALIAGAIRRLPETVAEWQSALPAGRPVVVYCVHGREVSQDAAAALRAAGVDAA
jgi:rhodanese-related sulfurtransferase